MTDGADGAEEELSELDAAIARLMGDTDMFLNSLDPARIAEFQAALDGVGGSAFKTSATA